MDFTDEPIDIRVRDIQTGWNRIKDLDDSYASLAPDSRVRMEPGELPISNYGTQIRMSFAYETRSEADRKNLVLERRTFEELERYFGEDGRPPYPWVE